MKLIHTAKQKSNQFKRKITLSLCQVLWRVKKEKFIKFRMKKMKNIEKSQKKEFSNVELI